MLRSGTVKLLLAGDSFAELELYSGHSQAAGYTPLLRPQPKGRKWVKHWVELLAQDIDHEVVSHGIAGAGISSSSFVALQQLLTGEYDAMVFCVSHHARTISNKDLDEGDKWANWKALAYNDVVFREGKGIDVYKDNTMYGKYVHMIDEGGGPYVQHINAEEVLQLLEGAIDQEEFARVTGDDETCIHYLQNKVGYSYIHDSLTAIVTLDTYCKAHNIPVVFASGFPSGVSDTIQDMGFDYKHFPFYETEDTHGFVARGDYPSHYSSEEHKLIYEDFKKLYPEYKTMFNKKD
jgi:hypothetical protein